MKKVIADFGGGPESTGVEPLDEEEAPPLDEEEPPPPSFVVLVESSSSPDESSSSSPRWFGVAAACCVQATAATPNPNTPARARIQVRRIDNIGRSLQPAAGALADAHDVTEL
jgi:hypothetical protein